LIYLVPEQQQAYLFAPLVQVVWPWRASTQSTTLPLNSNNLSCYDSKGQLMKRLLITGAALATVFSVPTPALADMALASAKNCMACHAVEKKLVGPSYKDIASKYAGQADAVDKLAGKVIKGGAGVWGPVPMPANPQINDADAKKLVLWIMAGSK
jgi:cytochrome c